jgi:hypothetical protein
MFTGDSQTLDADGILCCEPKIIMALCASPDSMSPLTRCPIYFGTQLGVLLQRHRGGVELVGRCLIRVEEGDETLGRRLADGMARSDLDELDGSGQT